MRAEIKASQEEMKGGLEEMKATVWVSQENMEAAISSIQSKIGETIKNPVEDILSSVDQWTQGLCQEHNKKIEETQLDLQAEMKDLHKELDLRILQTQIDIQAIKILA
jgi:hypothetical protein